jgi:branched-chain amino acid transport system ATP-binding protein
MTPERTIVSGLSFGYADSLLFDNFSLQSRSRILVFKGPSGSGKTTLLKLLFGWLKPNCPAVLPPHQGASLMLQDDALFPWLSGRANISQFIQLGADEIETHPLFPIVSEFIDRRAYAMSFGQRRSVELFRMILLKPDIMYLDEPFNYLDDYKANRFIDFLAHTEISKLLIVTTHRNDTALDAVADTFHFTGLLPYRGLERKAA